MCRPLHDCLIGLREYVVEMKREGEPVNEAIDYAMAYAEEHYHPNNKRALSIALNVYYWR